MIVLPLLVRRRWPVPVLVWTMLATAIIAARYDQVVPVLAILIALYTVIATEQRRIAVVSIALLEAAALLIAGDFPGDNRFYDSIFLTGMIASATAIGLYAATRRAYLEQLHERAERLEREKIQTAELAAVAERSRIAREMHDIVAHHLTVMVALSDGAVATSAKSPERAVEVMRTVSATGRRALADTRRLLGVLRDDAGTADPAEPTRQPLPDLAELDELIDSVRDAGLPTSLQVHGKLDELPEAVQLTVYRVVQEALTNAMKHGGPGVRADVRLHRSAAELFIEVVDTGAGAGALTTAGTGSGLTGMQERVHAFGGELSTGPRATGGWGVAARLRLDTDS